MGAFVHLKTVSDLFKLFYSNKNIQHPLVAVVDFSKVDEHIRDDTRISAGFYSMMFKNYSKNNIKYGRKVVDFQDGNLICMAPNQIIEMDNDVEVSENMLGWGLFFHPDLIRTTSLGHKIKGYNFFSYEISEGLHLSEKEKQILYDCVLKIQTELKENIDEHSQNIIVSTLELLLNYCSRFYGRQFITRKTVNHDLLTRMEQLLNTYFEQEEALQRGLPTVEYLAGELNLSPRYLGDLLRSLTGHNAQQHIHEKLIEKAKDYLTETHLSVSEIAYQLGFEHPQSFSKLFKAKTQLSPLEFKQSFN
ncbi:MULTISPECIES: helix-turn-helix domain-containing protein [Sphingobacterium]|uniref:helix-turn-helix domain-containing protein n=1 Tax=Sphingobacterium TaxID=28453 RepID=UPI0010470812|nr:MULTISPECIES: response regulator transcription factor [Sphingobacterium]MCW2259758.1 AraC-like DNA-binding protein [Sphingobacterium kitahiroshimense]TCR03402.1 helix-turn-helix protein [Sphingobacterium sp. JUb78]